MENLSDKSSQKYSVGIAVDTGLGNFILKYPLLKLLQNDKNIAKIYLISTNINLINQIINYFNLSGLIYINLISINDSNIKYLLLPFDCMPHNYLIASYRAKINTRIKHQSFPENNIVSKLRHIRQTSFYPNTTYVPLLASRHETDLNLDLGEALLKKSIVRDNTVKLHVNTDKSVLEKFGIPYPFVVYQMGGANGTYSAKIWHPENAKQIIDGINNELHLPVVLLGDSGDKKQLVPYLDNLPKKCINLINKTTLAEAIQIINASSLVIAHDSGLMHIADALSKPLIALYGPTDIARTRPLKQSSQIVVSQNEYTQIMYNFNCTEADLEKENTNFKIMSGLNIETVWRAVQEAINKNLL
ncbi:MAG: glycosyltransferase family 9 protein [Chitinophagales bacterium]|nr:hypothetical protein [Bacteroidota bacterium]MCB9044483.1 hypothetical protein [Chitinophagales bacterium]